MLSANQISDNWNHFLKLVNEDESARGNNMSSIIDALQSRDRLIMYPNSHKPQYGGSYAGGFIEHILNVYEFSIKLSDIWLSVAQPSYTMDELKFVALYGSLGKIGTFVEVAFKKNSSQWHIDNKGENYMFNDKIPYMSVSDRTLWLLSQINVKLTENEYLAIKLMQGMYDESNKPYLMSYLAEAKPRTTLVYIIHQAEVLASRLTFERNK